MIWRFALEQFDDNTAYTPGTIFMSWAKSLGLNEKKTNQMSEAVVAPDCSITSGATVHIVMSKTQD